MSETCSCTKDFFFVKDKFAGVEGNEQVQRAATGRFFLCYFPFGPHVLSHSTEKEVGPLKRQRQQ